MKAFLSLLALLLTFTAAVVSIESASFDEDVSTVIVDNYQDEIVSVVSYESSASNDIYLKNQEIESDFNRINDFYVIEFVEPPNCSGKTDINAKGYNQPFVDKNKKAIAHRSWC